MMNLAHLLPIQHTIRMDDLFEKKRRNGESKVNLDSEEYYGFDEQTSYYYKIKTLDVPMSGIVTWQDVNGNAHTTNCSQMAMKPGKTDKVLFIRCTVEEHEYISNQARLVGVSVNKWVLSKLINC
jgi:hypothetical protein